MEQQQEEQETQERQPIAEDAGVEELNQDLAKFTAKVIVCAGGDDEFLQRKAELRGELDHLCAQINQLKEEKDGINKVVGDKEQERGEMLLQLDRLKDLCGYATLQEVDDRISEIELGLRTVSLSRKEENELLEEIQDLKRLRPKLSQVDKMAVQLQTLYAGRSWYGRLQNISLEMHALRQRRRDVSARLTELTEGGRGQIGTPPEFSAEEYEVGENSHEDVAERNRLRDAIGAWLLQRARSARQSASPPHGWTPQQAAVMLYSGSL